MSLWAGVSVMTVVQAGVYIICGFTCDLVFEKLTKRRDHVYDLKNTHEKEKQSKPIAISNSDHLLVMDSVQPKLIRSLRLPSSSVA